MRSRRIRRRNATQDNARRRTPHAARRTAPRGTARRRELSYVL